MIWALSGVWVRKIRRLTRAVRKLWSVVRVSSLESQLYLIANRRCCVIAGETCMHTLENIFYLNYYLKHDNNIICNFHKIILHSTNPWTPDLTQFFGKSLLVVRKANLCKILLPISSGVLGGNLLIAPRRLPAMARNHFEGISRGAKHQHPLWHVFLR